MKHLWSLTHDNKEQKCKAQFYIDNWDKYRYKRHCLTASAKEFLNDD